MRDLTCAQYPSTRPIRESGGNGRRKAWTGLFVGLVAVLCAHGARAQGLAPSERLEPVAVVATVAMIGEPLARMVGPAAQVEILMGEGVDPHLYRPTRTDIVRLNRADIILYNGLNLEAQLSRPIEQLSGRKTVLAVAETLGSGILLAYDDGPGDPHVWMDPNLWQEALRAGLGTVMRKVSGGDDGARERAEAYFARLGDLQSYADRVMASVPSSARVLITAHDAFGYFGKRYGLDVRGIQGISTESEAGLRAIADLVDLIVIREVPAVFAESSVSEQQVRALIDGAKARGQSVILGGTLFSDAMGPPGTYEGTYIGMIDHNVTTIARALGGDVPETGAFGLLGSGKAAP